MERYFGIWNVERQKWAFANGHIVWGPEPVIQAVYRAFDNPEAVVIREFNVFGQPVETLPHAPEIMERIAACDPD